MAVLDLRMPGGGGLELLKELRRQDPSTRVLMLTGYGSISTAVEAVREGAVGYLPKPADADEILAALNGTNTAKQSGVETPSLARAEWEHIQRVLTDCGGNISEAARRLGIHRRSLQRKLHKYPPVALKLQAPSRRGRQCAVPGAACPCRSGAPAPTGAPRILSARVGSKHS